MTLLLLHPGLNTEILFKMAFFKPWWFPQPQRLYRANTPDLSDKDY